MKTRESVVRLKQFQVEERRRQVVQIETMIAEFERMAADLSAQIAAEQDRTGIHDAAHFAYSTFAKAAAQRRDNLAASVAELRAQLAVAAETLAAAEEDLSKVEAMLERDQERERTSDDGAGRGRGHTAALAG